MSEMKLAEKLLEIKKRVPYLKPNQKGFNYDYANPSRVLGVFNPLFNEYGILFTSEVTSTLAEPITITSVVGIKTKPETLREVNKTEILHTAFMVFRFEDVKSGEVKEVNWAGTGNNGVEQGFGSALTYAQRYFLLNYFGVPVDNEDPNFIQTVKMTESSTSTKEEKDLKPMTAALSKQMIDALDKGKRTPAQIRTALSEYKDGAQKTKVEEKLLNL